jgi:hypothetical protein
MAKARVPASGDGLIATVVGDPKSPRRARILRGFLAESSRDRSERLYLDLAFQSYVDISSGDIYAKKTVALQGSPVDVTFVWVSQDAELKGTLGVGGLGFPSITEFNCPVQTIHTDCPTTTFNVPGCGTTESGCQTEFGCGGNTEVGCGETEIGCGTTEDCVRGFSRGRRRRYW